MTITRILARVAVPVGLAAGTCLAAVPPSYAAAPSNGCPSHYELMNVQQLTNAGYGVPAQLDDPSSGALSFGNPGNGDNRVCALKLGNQTSESGLQIYNFWDNTLRNG